MRPSFADGTPQRGVALLLKAVGDRVSAATLLVLAAPAMVGIAIAVRAGVGSPIIFSQERPGRGGLPFHIYKFRTMREAYGPDGKPLPDEERITPTGRLLRAWSIDELPQLWNVVRGELSLVGPRPLRMHYLPRYTREQSRRHEVLPGITGWAQVNGRNAISWEEKFTLDVWYVNNWSLLLDLKILATTLLMVMRRSGVSKEGHATMPEFMGTGPEGPDK